MYRYAGAQTPLSNRRTKNAKFFSLLPLDKELRNTRPSAALIWVLGLALLPSARAAPPPIAQAEIHYLLESVENSGCEFYRNGARYDSKKARAHLHCKYAILSASGRINTAEDFIENAATCSRVSGRPYQVRCAGTRAVTSSQWLRKALERYRLRRAQRDTRVVRGHLVQIRT